MSAIESIVGAVSIPTLENPFQRSKITWVNVYFDNYSGWVPREKRAKGSVKFENGSTKGEQDFYGASIGEVLRQMIAFCNSL